MGTLTTPKLLRLLHIDLTINSNPVGKKKYIYIYMSLLWISEKQNKFSYKTTINVLKPPSHQRKTALRPKNIGRS